MNTKQGTTMILVLLLSLVMSSCAPGQIFGPTVTPTSTSTPLPTDTPTIIPSTPTPALPTYSDVLKTYPAGTDLCSTDAQISVASDGSLALSGSASYSDAGGIQYQCYGTKITIVGTVTLDDVFYDDGTKLTVDKDLKWIQVSSWE